MWDVIRSCEIVGSSDSSIRNVTANPIGTVLEKSRITAVYANGSMAKKLYDKYSFAETGLPAVRLPSTSPANAAWTLDRLVEAWKTILDPVEVPVETCARI